MAPEEATGLVANYVTQEGTLEAGRIRQIPRIPNNNVELHPYSVTTTDGTQKGS